ncbi:MAG: hypothetical protein AAF560_25880 [Acidobacteriota bacterium]
MSQDAAVKALHAAITQLEYALAQLGDGLQFLVKVEGGLEIVRRGEDGLPTRPKDVVAELAGADPLLWQAERPEGDVLLGPGYGDQKLRCALSGQFLSRSGPVELYYRGRPVDPATVFPRAPVLTLLQSFATSLNILATEVWQRVSRGDLFAETDLMMRDVVIRLRHFLSQLELDEEEPTPAKAGESAPEAPSTETTEES